MRIAKNRRYGRPAEIHIVKAAVPPVRPGVIRVAVKYSSVNRTDLAFLQGRPLLTRLMYGFPRPRYPALGSEFAGVVDQVGDGVEAFSPGDRVFGFDDVPTGFGGHAEYKLIDHRKMVGRIPHAVSFERAAAGRALVAWSFRCEGCRPRHPRSNPQTTPDQGRKTPGQGPFRSE